MPTDIAGLMMAFDDNSDPIGLLLTDPTGLYTRADGQWFVITPDNLTFNGATVVDVDSDFLDFYDKLDAKGSDPTYKQAQSYALPEQEPAQ